MAKRISKKKNLKELILFLVRFNLLLIPFYLIIYFDISFYPLQILLASFIAKFLNFLKFDVKAASFFVYLGKSNFPIDISRDCTGWKSVYSISALTFATKKGRLKDKLKFLSLAIPFFLLMNFFRITSTIILGFYLGFQYIDFIHNTWQFLVIFLILFVWWLWLKKINSKE